MKIQITADMEVENMTEMKQHLPEIMEELFTFGYDPKVNVSYPKE